ncbi:MAG: glycerol-3-phosphate dehydrogenase/oxidase [Bacteriovoracaceae bacterium]|nr:glycerol-3-phosphate dehydrogenase/oxidase [Bacteriovoracaceae bacterium]
MKKKIDVVVIGGGITGAGIVRDCAMRGLKTMIVEKNDFSSGTSSKSGKLIHGGLRYLEFFQLKLVFESCLERHRLLKIVAPHIVRPVNFVIPFYKTTKHPKWFIALGLLTYDILSLFRNIKHFTNIGRKKLIDMEPLLKKETSKGALAYYDCAALDTRLTIDSIKSAEEAGATILNYTEVKEINFSDAGVDLRVLNLTNNNEYTVSTKTVINATGVWADELMKLTSAPDSFNLKMTSGIHLIFSKERLPISNTLALESVKDKRPLYLVPWKNFVLLGTTDRFFNGDKDNPTIEDSEIDYLLESLNHYFPDQNLTRNDIISITTGIRPLIGSNKGKSEGQISRDYEIITDSRGMISITGGKLTSYRSMAKKTVDRLIKKFFQERDFKKCMTISPISGGDIEKINLDDLSKKHHVERKKLELLFERYGSNITSILSHGKHDKSKFEYISNDFPYSWAEIDYIVREEFVERLSDLLERRTIIYLSHPCINKETLIKIANYVGSIKDWNENKIQDEIQYYEQHTLKNIKEVKQ